MAAPAKSVEEQLEEMFASDGEVPGDARASTAAATTVPEDVPETNDDAVVRSRGKKRLRNEDKWLRNVRKERRALGQEYVNRKGNLVPRKELRKISECTCRYECHKHINEEQQEQVFNEFYNLGSHDLQSAFLFTMIKVVDKARSYVGQQHSRREKTRLYYLLNSNGSETRVCKRFFQNTLAVSAGRIDRVLKNKGEKATPPRDGRGKGEPGNKTPRHKVDVVKRFIEKFPAYESHYAYHKNNGRKYLGPDLNLSVMYSLYCAEEQMPVSHFIFRKIFYENFNLSFHPPVSDSCRTCDALQVKITAADNDKERTELIAEREFHQQKAEYARAGLHSDTLLSKSDGNVTVITFDLMKTLPTPIISTGVCYYKRSQSGDSSSSEENCDEPDEVGVHCVSNTEQIVAPEVYVKEGKVLFGYDTLKRWQEYIEELYQGDPLTDNMIELSEEVEKEELGDTILKDEFEKALKELPDKKAAGVDDIPSELIKGGRT
ncbi:uncharacterized protein LOC124718660 [Schistocerca piceifrons]|uniref:uncharacterized protein LOC124718660 n=1 Tax=Schistocerca piceifrons TaxID=274613 RepID=UPI001F5E63AA|nr:uncharacterized protein LOC124718660 [Schistocerca piceifrons]